MSDLTVKNFINLCVRAENILRDCGHGAPSPNATVVRDYGIYRLGDSDFLAVGLTWLERETETWRSAKISGGAVTDHYIYFDPADSNKKYRSAEIDPATREYIALYESKSDGTEPKLAPDGTQILQQNFHTTQFPLPDEYALALNEVDFPFMNDIIIWSNKPYGQCVEFTASHLNGI